MYVYTYIRIYIRLYVCIYVCMYGTYVHMYYVLISPLPCKVREIYTKYLFTSQERNDKRGALVTH
jgi:hypothetical protein